MTIKLIDITVINLAEKNRIRNSLATEQERKKFDDNWTPNEYYDEYEGPFDELELNEEASFDDFLPDGMVCPGDFDMCYGITVLDDEGRRIQINACSKDLNIGDEEYIEYGQDCCEIETDACPWSIKGIRKIIERHKDEIDKWNKKVEMRMNKFETYEEITADLVKSIMDVTNRYDATVSDIESVEKNFKAWKAVSLSLAVVSGDNQLKRKVKLIMQKNKEN